jgi:anaerobic selenocysteine-containing dehydrogenase
MTEASLSEEPAREVFAVCPHDCPDTCAMRVTVVDGRAVKVHGDPDHPTTLGALCTKVSRYPERTYHPDRVLTPLKRVSAKTEPPRFEPISWDEALDLVATRLKAIASRGPGAAQAILPYSYAGTMGLVQGESMAARFFHRLGASLLDRTICASAGADALTATYGSRVGLHVEDVVKARLIVIWGSHSIASNLHFWMLAQEAKRQGARLVCIDPRRTETADKCHAHLALKPGTDGALALGLMNEWIRLDLLRQADLETFVDDWPLLREQALAWPVARAAEICGLTEEEITQLARDMATIQPAAIRLNYGMQRVHGGGNAVRLIALLPCLIGAWRQAGGGLLLSASGWFDGVVDSARLQRPDFLPTPRPRTLNMSTIGDDLLRDSSAEFGPRIEALVVYNSNPVAVAPQSSRVVDGFQRPDLFTVVLEHFMTDTADMADVVLPATTQLEHWDAHKSYGHTYAMINRPAIAPVGQALSNAEIFRRLAAHMGFDDPAFADGDEDLVRQAFRADRLDVATLFEQGWVRVPVPTVPFAEGGFPTPSGRAQVRHPVHGLPRFIPNHECEQTAPELAARYPLAMISPPARHFLNSTFVNVRSLRDIEGEPRLEIHPDDAAARCITSGEVVEVYNDRGRHRCRADVSTRARPGVVVGLGIWWRKLGLDGTNVNQLTSQKLTDIGAAPTFYDCLVEVVSAA